MTQINPTPSPSRWSLGDLFPSDTSPELESAFTGIDERTAAFEARRGQLNEDLPTGTFLEMVRQLEAINSLANRLYAFAELTFSQDTQDQAAQALLVRVEQFITGITNRLLFFILWWKDLTDEAAGRLMADSGDYAYWLEEMRHFKDFTLSEAEEKVINLKDSTGARAIKMLYNSLTNRYTFKLAVDGEEQQLTRGQLSVYARHHDAGLRSRAYQELYRVYGADGPILGQMYQALVNDWRNENLSLRGFESSIGVRNLANDIPDEVVDTLLGVCRRNAPLFQRFFKLKARRLGMEKLRRYDIYAPVAKSDRQFAFGEACDLVMGSFEAFDPQLAELAARVFSEQHIDSEVRQGKRSGAFCLTALPDLTPWVLLNYQGKTEDVATMAHELGHAIHSMLASHHSLFTFHASLPLAETASTFGEMMLVDKLLKEEAGEAVRRDLLFRQVDDAYATILRQTYFAIFEKQAHQMVKENATVDMLCEAYMENLKEQFGDAVELSDEFRWEWVSIPHIYSVPFYVYAYAFGQLLVLSLYQQYRAEGEAFKPRYLKILSTGGAEAPVRLLADAGIDVYQEAFWQGGFVVVEGLVAQLEGLAVDDQ